MLGALINIFSQFVISSTADIDFGSFCVGSSLTKQITIENKGTFPFDYTIEGKPEPEDPTQKVAVKKKGKRSKTSTPVAVKRAKRSEKSILVSIIDTQLLFNGIIDFPFFSTTVKKAFQEYHEQVIETEDYPIIYYPDNFSSRQTSQRIKNIKEEIVHDETEMMIEIPPLEANTQMALSAQISSGIYISRSPANSFSGYQSPAMNFSASQPLLYSPARKHSPMMSMSRNDDNNQSHPPFF